MGNVMTATGANRDVYDWDLVRDDRRCTQKRISGPGWERKTILQVRGTNVARECFGRHDNETNTPERLAGRRRVIDTHPCVAARTVALQRTALAVQTEKE